MLLGILEDGATEGVRFGNGVGVEVVGWMGEGEFELVEGEGMLVVIGGRGVEEEDDIHG